ncbi:HAD family hydrolase [Brenneria goodwinii]|uniref:HAD family hydrolase n=1 Tax=Brenneria goodwinii TaxID=1109412 RepID=UPI0036E6B98D
MKKVVYDLDGTLIKFNTFKCWVILSFVISVFFIRFCFLFSFLKFAYLRKIKILDRVSFKSSILTLQVNSQFWITVGSIYGRVLAKFFIRNDIIKMDKEALRCLATAAPDIYARPFAQEVRIFNCIITSYFSEDGCFVETLNREKLRHVSFNFSSSPDILYTDHYDDIPLAEKCKFTFIVSPSDTTREYFTKAMKNSNYRVIH